MGCFETERPAAIHGVERLVDPGALRCILGVEGDVRVEPMDTFGYSAARFDRVTTGATGPFIVKRVATADDWLSNRTKDRVGREAALMTSPAWDLLCESFRLPYRAVATDNGRYGLLMEDWSAWLLPDERAPIAADDETLILDAMARLHARFWESPELETFDWLHRPADFFYILGPRDHESGQVPGISSRQLQGAVREGWAVARSLLGPETWNAITCPPQRFAESFAHLPCTLVHGDAKMANFAILPDQQVGLFDWAFAGRTQGTCDLGWYLAVNASRLARPQERVITQYRSFLEAHLGCPLDDGLWAELVEAGLLCGAMMLGWAKAAAVAAGREGAEKEWEVWARYLDAWARRAGRMP
ncbi:MAG: phosphotransferase [Phycisphaeraceae bacterium]|nr:phosphotransferase [Phycisphaeraceae bacterium]